MHFPDPCTSDASRFPYGNRLPSPFLEPIDDSKARTWADVGSQMTGNAPQGGPDVMYHPTGGDSRN